MSPNSSQQSQSIDDIDVFLPTDSAVVDADAEQGIEPNDLETEAIAFVSRINERVRRSAETLTPMGVPRVA